MQISLKLFSEKAAFHTRFPTKITLT